MYFHQHSTESSSQYATCDVQKCFKPSGHRSHHIGKRRTQQAPAAAALLIVAVFLRALSLCILQPLNKWLQLQHQHCSRAGKTKETTQMSIENTQDEPAKNTTLTEATTLACLYSLACSEVVSLPGSLPRYLYAAKKKKKRGSTQSNKRHQSSAFP